MNRITEVYKKSEKQAKKDKKIKTNTTNKYITVFQFISLAVIVFCILKIINWNKENNSNSTLQSQLLDSISFDFSDTSDTTDSESKILNFSELIRLNENAVGWVIVPGTNINYGVVQGKDNDYYLTHSFDKTLNSAGWIFADYRNKFDGSDKNIIIYGHNRRDGTMFSSLKNILNKNWYSNPENQIITFYTPEKTLFYSVFSVYQTEAVDFNNQTSFASNNEFLSYAKTVKSRSIYDFDEDITAEDQIITLSTCANNNAYRVILHAKLVN